MRLGVLITNTDRSVFAARHPGDGDKFRALLLPRRPDWDLPSFDLVQGQFPDLSGFDGFILGGSPASVHDSDPWIAQAQTLIRQAHAAGIKLFGACFGHQVIARALGGTVARNPGGWVLGTVDTRFDGTDIRLYAAHAEQVTALPPGLQPTGATDGCPIAAYGGPGILSTQYHPEMTHGFITALVEEIAPKLPEQVLTRARASLTNRADTDLIAQRIIRFFEA